MNLFEFSEQNNSEMGVFISRIENTDFFINLLTMSDSVKFGKVNVLYNFKKIKLFDLIIKI
jgi:hypothetical protein